MFKKRGMRGPDAKPRKRRTKAEIEASRALQGDKALLSDLGIGGIDTIALNGAVPVDTGLDAAVADKFALVKMVQQSVNEVLATVLPAIDAKAKAILSEAKTLASANQIAVAIKVNDAPIKHLGDKMHPMLGEVTAELLALTPRGLFPMLVGPAGCGKTYLAEQIAETLELSFGHLCFSAGASETWLFGRQTPTGFVEGEFSRAYREGGLFLADELDAADQNVLLALNTSLSNGHLYNPINGQSIKRHPKFYFIAGANTVGKGGDIVYTGRNSLDGATLDRAKIIRVDYLPSVEDKFTIPVSLKKSLRETREKLKKRGIPEIVSYRAFLKAEALHSIGYSNDKIMRAIAEPWSDDAKAECLVVHK